jgi:hypothetical protein
VARYSDCSANDGSGLEYLIKMFAALKRREA